MSKLLEAALDYAEQGWSVIPCEPRGKKPLIKWEPYTKRRATKDEINKWWGDTPNANIAIITGEVSGIVAVDIDTGRGGSESNQKVTGLVANTGGGGAHLLYRYPGVHVPNKVGSDGVDVRGDGGYIIVHPSIHSSGTKYVWRSRDKPSDAPTWTFAKGSGENKEAKTGGVDKWLTNAFAGAGIGQRNDTAARLAGYLAKKEIPEDVATSILNSWSHSLQAPLSRAEVGQTVESVYRTAKRDRETVSTSPLDFINLTDYGRKHAGKQTQWTVEDWLPRATIAIISSPPGSFKTWLLIDLAVSIASGKPFLGSKVNRPGPVLFVQQEDPHGLLLQRFSTVMLSKYQRAPSQTDGENFEEPWMPTLPIYIHEERRLRFDDSTSISSLEEKIEKYKPAAIMVDPLYSAAETEDYMAGSARNMLALKRLRDQHDCSFVICHHTRKSSDSWDRQEIWGSQFLNAFLETGWHLRKIPSQEAVALKRHFKVSGPQDPLKIEFDIDTSGDFKYNAKVTKLDEEEAEKAATHGASGSSYMAALEDAAKALSTAEVAEKVGKTKGATARYLRKLEKQGEVEQKDGLWKATDLPDF